jgi:hypothetical protein
MVRDVAPTAPGDFVGIIQPHFSINDLAQKAFSVPRADGHEIRPHGKGKGTARRAPYARRMEW